MSHPMYDRCYEIVGDFEEVVELVSAAKLGVEEVLAALEVTDNAPAELEARLKKLSFDLYQATMLFEDADQLMADASDVWAS